MPAELTLTHRYKPCFFLMNTQKWWHIQIMWTSSSFNAYNSEWVWEICIPDQTRKGTNEKLQGFSDINITSNLILVFQRIWKSLSIRLYYVAIFLLKSPWITWRGQFSLGTTYYISTQIYLLGDCYATLSFFTCLI